MTDVYEMTTDNPRNERETERPRQWRMRQPTKDQLRERIREQSIQIAHLQGTTRLKDELIRKCRIRTHAAFVGGVALAATACVAGVWLAPLLLG